MALVWLGSALCVGHGTISTPAMRNNPTVSGGERPAGCTFPRAAPTVRTTHTHTRTHDRCSAATAACHAGAACIRIPCTIAAWPACVSLCILKDNSCTYAAIRVSVGGWCDGIEGGRLCQKYYVIIIIRTCESDWSEGSHSPSFYRYRCRCCWCPRPPPSQGGALGVKAARASAIHLLHRGVRRPSRVGAPPPGGRSRRISFRTSTN